MILGRYVFALLVLLQAAAPSPARAHSRSPRMPCAGLTGLALPHTTIVSSESVPEGSFDPPGRAAPIAGLPSFCRVIGVARPTPDSEIGFEVWLPTSTWNGKYRQSGNGGFAGTIPFAGLAAGILADYATAGTDEGILAGAPANDWTRLFSGFVWNERALLDANIPQAKLATVQAATLAQCDTIDGIADGVLEDPRRCDLDVSALLCPEGADGVSCLTGPEVAALEAILEGPTNPSTGEKIFPGYFPATAAYPGSWSA